jgi:hypothetical protein
MILFVGESEKYVKTRLWKREHLSIGAPMGNLEEATFTGDSNRAVGKRSVSLCESSVRGTGGMAPLLGTLKLGLSITRRHA